ncbi:hypothetical protein Tco_1385132 [Tanacetum coccineum]
MSKCSEIFSTYVQGYEFDEPPTEEEALSFIRELGHSGEIKYITDVIVDHLHQPWRTFAAIINKCLCGKVYGFDKIRLSRVQILWGMYYKKNLDFVALIWEDLAYQIDNIDSKKQDKMFYPRFTKIIIHHFLEKGKSISMRNRMFMHTARDDYLLGTMRFVSRYADTQELNPPTSRKSQKKLDSTISSEESPSKKKSAKAKKVVSPKPKPTKEKAPIKADRGDGTDFELGVPDEQYFKTTGANEGTGTIPGVPDIPKYDSKSKKESWGDSGEEDEDDENDFVDKSDDGDDDNNGNDDANDDDNQEGDDTNDDEEETDSDRTESDIIKNPVLNQSTTEYYEEEEEKIDDEEMMDDDEDDEVTKELYKHQVEEYALTPVLDIQKADEPVQSSSISSDFTSKLLNLKNSSLTDNEIALLMETSARHATEVPKIISIFTTTIPPPPPFFNPLPQQAIPTPTPTTSEATTSFPSLLDFSSVLKFNDRVTNLEKDLSEIKQVNKYAQALSSIPAIVDRYIDNKLGKAINKAIQAHNLDCRQEAQDEKNDYIELVDTSMRTIIKEVTTQLPQILPQEVYDFATPVIEKNIAKSLEAAVLKRGVEMTETKIETPPLDQTEGRNEGSQERKLSHPEIQGQRKRSLQAPLKMPHTLNRSLLESLPMQRSQVTQLMTRECNRIKSSTWVTMINNPLARRFPRMASLRNPNDVQLLILIGIRDNMLTSDLLRPVLVKLLMLKNLILHSMSSWIPLIHM